MTSIRFHGEDCVDYLHRVPKLLPVMKSGYIDTIGLQIYYEMHSEGEPLLLIMGIGGDFTMWALYQVPAF